MKAKKEKKQKIVTTAVEGTPFHVVETENGCFVCMGNNRLTEMMSREEAFEDAKTINWNKIIQLFQILYKFELIEKENN